MSWESGNVLVCESGNVSSCENRNVSFIDSGKSTFRESRNVSFIDNSTFREGVNALPYDTAKTSCSGAIEALDEGDNVSFCDICTEL